MIDTFCLQHKSVAQHGPHYSFSADLFAAHRLSTCKTK